MSWVLHLFVILSSLSFSPSAVTDFISSRRTVALTRITKPWHATAVSDRVSSSTRIIFHVQDIILGSTAALSHRHSLSIHHLLTFSTLPWQLPGARGEWLTPAVSFAPVPAPRAPDIRPVLSDPSVYRFLSLLPALIIHAAESHTHQRDSWEMARLPARSLPADLILSVPLHDTVSSSYMYRRLEKTNTHQEETGYCL